MIRSMTGFGTASAAVEGHAFIVEVRSVNGRNLKAYQRLPAPFICLESEFEEIIRRALKRGTITVVLYWDPPEDAVGSAFHPETLRAYRDAVRDFAAAEGADAGVGLSDLLGLPGVFTRPEDGLRVTRFRGALTGLLGEALDGLDRMRRAEGEALQGQIAAIFDAVAAGIGVAEGLNAGNAQRHHERLIRRVRELVEDVNAVDERAVAREVAFFASRSDVSEELVRIRSHLAQGRAMLTDGDAGRGLEFLGQELQRETSTLSSKAACPELAAKALELRLAVDGFREQAANVE